ncbi:ADP-ribosyltransferase [Legionella israelensis]|uniref:ADP-ribosyltransferase n=1 Tax=Legionella israelensis TaxID=454 RepID=UPI00163DA18A|nr:ADP-ribosyltransferase [Legionella israelensis]
MKAILDPQRSIDIAFNYRDELEIIVDNHPFNLTQILKNVDFEHLVFPQKIYTDYAEFLRGENTVYKPHLDPIIKEKGLESGEFPEYVPYTFPSEKEFAERDPEGLYDELAYGEKLAINIYTTSAYSNINTFLRSKGQDTEFRKYSKEEQLQLVSELVLVSAIASTGLSKIRSTEIQELREERKEPVEMGELQRYEKSDEIKKIIEDRRKDIKKKRAGKSQAAFISSSARDDVNFSKYKRYDVKTTIKQPHGLNPMGKKVSPLAEVQTEEEVLFTPGVQLKFYKYRKQGKNEHFTAIPHRSLEDISPFSYSHKNMEIRRDFMELSKQLIEASERYFDKDKSKNSLFSSGYFAKVKSIIKGLDKMVDYLEGDQTFKREVYLNKLSQLRALVNNEIGKHKKNDNPNENLQKISTILGNVSKFLDKQINIIHEELVTEVDPAKLLSDMPRLDKRFQSMILEDVTARENIVKIKEICNERYQDQAFYGNASLNRKILLDEDIANLLTPQTIALIFAEHQQLKKQKKLKDLKAEDRLALLREGKEKDTYISLADAIFYGFSDGLDVIKYMPNNDPRYGRKEYEAQKLAFDKNTNKMIGNIVRASVFFDIQPHEKKYQLKTSSIVQIPLKERFELILKVIDNIKAKKLSEKLLFVPGFTSESIRSQCIAGMRRFCNLKQEGKNIIVTDEDVKKLKDLARKFVSESILLNGSVSHLFYDRVHLEAALEQNTKIIINENAYTLADLFREIIDTCPDSLLAQEQFDKRFSLIEAHLQTHFPREWSEGIEAIHQMRREGISHSP